MLTTDLLIDLVLRWMHIFAAVAAVGGLIYLRLALMPAMDVLDDQARSRLQDALRARWSKVVAGSILFLLVSGLVNFVFIVLRYDVARPLYHPLFGVKFLLALVVFFISSAIHGRSALAARLRQNMRYWVNLNLLLAVLVIALSGVLRVLPKTEKPLPPAAAAAAAAAPIVTAPAAATSDSRAARVAIGSDTQRRGW